MSIRYKIAFLFAGLVCFILLCLCTAVYMLSARERSNLFHTRLKNRATGTANTVAHSKDGNFGILGMLDTSSVASLQHKTIMVLNFHGSLVYRYSDNPGLAFNMSPQVVEQTKIRGEYYFKTDNREAIAIHLVNSDNNFIVAIAAEDIDGAAYLENLRKLLTWSFIIAVLLSFITGVVFARAILSPLARIISEVKLVSLNNPSQRIRVPDNKDELQELSKTFNELLNKMQESFIIQRRFISNASHELSTPLTAVSSQLEVTLQKDRSEEEYRQVMKSVQEDVKSLQQLTRSLLEIARSGSQGSLELKMVRIDEVLMKAASDVQKLKEEYVVQVDFETFPNDEQMLTAFGNSDLLYIAFRNLFENGCKYSDNHSARVLVSFSNTSVFVLVKSLGDIISEADIRNIFHPFFRTETVSHKPGFGLGLTLSKRVLALHKSTIEVSSNPYEGTTFTITIPHCGFYPQDRI
ncbi:MAG: HAMP domain-containing histidine kinase [Chitinophagaceae bacterium]|nr:HAMP domain-containing histidine kinase [Chitinophagaceae bacterium]